MEGLFNLWAKRIPRYNAEYEFLFEKFALKANSDKDEDLQSAKGLIFSTYYEFYIYGFFLGIYSGTSIPVKPGDGNKDFSWAIENWGRKNARLSFRKDFTTLQKYMFSMVIAESDIDLLQLELNDSPEEIKKAISTLVNIMESFTNGGLELIKEKIEQAPNYFYSSPINPMNLILTYAQNLNKSNTKE